MKTILIAFLLYLAKSLTESDLEFIDNQYKNFKEII